MGRIFLVILILAGFHSSSCAQITFQKTIYGGFGKSCDKTSDGGCYVLGSSYSQANLQDAYVARFDSTGSMLWSRTYGTTQDENVMTLRTLADDGFVACGTTTNNIADDDMYFIRCNASGDTLWTRKYGNFASEYYFDFKVNPDGSFLVTGNNYYSGDHGSVFKVNASGDISWSVALSDSDNFWGNAMGIHSDGSFFIAGYLSNSEEYAVLYKFSAQGTLLWAKQYGNPNNNLVVYSLAVTPDGGCILTGQYDITGSLPIIRVDSNGDTLWTRMYDGPANDLLFSANLTDNGNFIATGFHEDSAGRDILVFGMDQSGDTLFTNVIGRYGYNETGSSIVESTDGALFITAGQVDSDLDSINIYFAKTDDQGRSRCQDKPSMLDYIGSLDIDVLTFQPSISSSGMPRSYITTVIDTGSAETTICSSIGIPEIISNVHLQIFPNPSSGIFQFSFLDKNPFEKLTICNTLGEIILQKDIHDKQELKFDLSHKVPGIYLIRFENKVQYQTARICLTK